MIDMRSDTLTKPTKEMRSAIHNVLVGDDCYGEDPNVNSLESHCKELFDVEAALFTPSGTMSNQIAIKAQVEEGNEVITHANYHINFYESASTAMLSRAVLNCTRTENGILDTKDVDYLVHSKPRGPLYSKVQMVTIENTINYYQGKTFPLENIKELHSYTKKNKIKLHLDGARLFNAHIATNVPLCEYAKHVDSLSVCFAKGLGAPYGSMLMGSEEFISKARTIRKRFGGGMHQIGMYAAAAQFALDHHLTELAKDHELTKEMATLLNKIDDVEINPDLVETNMIFMNIKHLKVNTDDFVKLCENKGLLVFPWLPGVIRMVITRHIQRKDVFNASLIIKEVIQELAGRCEHVC